MRVLMVILRQTCWHEPIKLLAKTLIWYCWGVGGNDVLRRVQSETTRANITATIGKLKSANIPVVLIS